MPFFRSSEEKKLLLTSASEKEDYNTFEERRRLEQTNDDDETRGENETMEPKVAIAKPEKKADKKYRRASAKILGKLRGKNQDDVPKQKRKFPNFSYLKLKSGTKDSSFSSWWSELGRWSPGKREVFKALLLLKL